MSQNPDNAADSPAREPFHFHFPDGSSVWVEVVKDANGEWHISDPEAAKMVGEMFIETMPKAGSDQEANPAEDDTPPVLRFHNPKTGNAVWVETVPDGKGGWRVSNPKLIEGLEPG